MEEKIVINRSDLEELIAKEIAKKLTSKPTLNIFADLNIFDKRIEELNRSKPEVVEYIERQQKKEPFYWVNFSDLVEERCRFSNGFNTTKPTIYNDPHNLIRKLVFLTFGSKTMKQLGDKEAKKARELYSEISSIFLTAYEEHLNDVVNNGREVSG